LIRASVYKRHTGSEFLGAAEVSANKGKRKARKLRKKNKD
jgi:hypothetical protein